jgi:acyl-CoA synthetase
LFDDLRRRVPTLRRLLVVEPGDRPALLTGGGPAPAAPVAGPPRLSDEVFLLNSTSGTTGLPKCVEHNQARWIRFAHHAVEAGSLTSDEVFLSALPTPFGFGLWTTHFTPARLGAPTVLLSRWDAEAAVERLVRQRVTVFAGVTTQLLMLLDVLEATDVDLPDLRVVFTGGEAVPYERARRFEERAGCAVLQFYGSNESGALSRTTVLDTPEKRLTTAGQLLPEMEVAIVDPTTGRPVPPGERGQPTCRGPLMSSGYFGDEAADAELFDADGRLRMPDLVELDDDGYLRVVGRVADIIIRGGMNISATDVEEALARHPDVERVAVVGAPDATFGERVCAFVVARADRSVDLDGLRAHMAELGMARHSWPELLHRVTSLPVSAGEKVAKGELRRWAADGGPPAPA